MFEIENMEKYDREIDGTFFKFMRNREYEKILGAIGRFGIYGVKNVLFILSQSPDARYVNSMRGWNINGRYVMSYSNPLRVLHKQYSKGIGNDENQNNAYSLGMAYEDKWTRHPEGKAGDTFVPRSILKNTEKYYPCFMKGVERLCQNIKDVEEISSLKNEIYNTLQADSYKQKDVEKSLSLASKLLAKDQYLATPELQKYANEEKRLALSIEYALKERYGFEKPSMDNDFSKYSDYELKAVALKFLHSTRALVNKQSNYINAEISAQEGRWLYERHRRSWEKESSKEELGSEQNFGM